MNANRGHGARRTGRLAALLAIVALGLSLRVFGYRLGLPFLIVKYGGSLLWGAMVYLLATLALPARPPRAVAAAAAAMGVAVIVELFRLVHAPWLDAFRLTLAGALLLGRIFSPWNILAYAIGIGLSAEVDRRTRSPMPGGSLRHRPDRDGLAAPKRRIP